MSLNEFFGLTEEAVSAIKIITYSIFLYLGIDGDVVEVLFVLMCVDTVLGSVKAVVLGKLFTFKKLMWGAVTKLSVLIIPMVMALVAKGLSFDFKWFVLAILNVLIVAEAFSSISNILSIKSKKNVENVDFVSLLLKAIRQGLANIVRKYLIGISFGIDEVDEKIKKEADNKK
jgi:phage-related holin